MGWIILLVYSVVSSIVCAKYNIKFWISAIIGFVMGVLVQIFFPLF